MDKVHVIYGSTTGMTEAVAAKDAGATLVGDVLKLDDTNEADQTDGKIAAWVETLKAAL